MLLHHISELDIQILEGLHAYLTEDGWVIPEWLEYLKGVKSNA